MLDFKGRWLRMQMKIILADPDIITMQEVDRLSSIQEDMESLGYSCGTAKYTSFSTYPDVAFKSNSVQTTGLKLRLRKTFSKEELGV
jgi:hypothetical protein